MTQPRNPRDILKVEAKAPDSYRRFSLVHLTAYSVYWLTQWDIRTNYENIYVLNAQLFPSLFTLPGFPEYPDATVTNRAILQMRPKYRGFATSNPQKGVFLTDKGLQEVAKVIEALGSPSIEGQGLPGTSFKQELDARARGRTHDPGQTVADCKRKLLYRRYKEGRFEETEPVHLLGLVSLYDHTPPSELRKKLKDLREDAKAISDNEFLRFLADVTHKFSSYVNRSDNR